MDPFQVALLTLAALTVGMLIPVLIQLWLTLRRVQVELRATQARIDPILAEVRAVVSQVRGAALVTSAITAAVTAGAQAWREAKQDEAPQSTQ